MPSVTLTDGTGGLEVAWMTAGTNDAQESVLWALVVQDVAYEAAYQVGVKVTGGTPTVFVFDQLAGPQENLTVTPEITDDGATVVVPWDALPGLEVGAIEWRAALNLDGADVAVCPLPGDDVLAPAKVTLNRD